jgi:hypothetical protein
MPVCIFISAVSDEFHDYRDQLRADLTRHNVEVKVQEDFKNLGGGTLEKLDTYIAHCHVVVHLVGEMTGSYPGDADLRTVCAAHPDLADRTPQLAQALGRGAAVSYTHWEAWLALYYGRRLIIAVAAADAPRGPKFEPTETSRAAQREHLNRLKQAGRYPGCEFASPDNLIKHVMMSGAFDELVKQEVAARGNRRALAAWIGVSILECLLIVGFAPIAPPWPPGITFGAIAIALLTLVLSSPSVLHHRAAAKPLPSLINIASAAVLFVCYLTLSSLFVYKDPSTGIAFAKGFVCTEEALELPEYNRLCPWLTIKQLSEAEYSAPVLWTSRSIACVEVVLASVWVSIFALLSMAIGNLAPSWAKSSATDHDSREG